MTLEFFYNNYDINDIEIKKVFIKDNKLNITGKYNVYLELIANGYRPEMNMDINKTFIFNVNHPDHKFKTNNVRLINDKNNFYMEINEEKLLLTGEVVCL